MLERVDRLTSPPVVGRVYLVPAMRFKNCGGVWFPVFGPRHADTDLGAPEEHYHYDVRFIGRTQIRVLEPFHRAHVDARVRRMSLRVLMLGVPDASAAIEGPTLRPMRCKHRMPTQRKLNKPFQWDTLLAFLNLTTFEEDHIGQTLKHGRCPHRGADLRSVPVRDGCKTCPLHGLRWDAKTGELVRRESEAIV